MVMKKVFIKNFFQARDKQIAYHALFCQYNYIYFKKMNSKIKCFANLVVDEANVALQYGLTYLYNTFLTAVITSLWFGNHSSNKTGE